MKQQVVLITGASSGIGYATAKQLAQQGHKVYAGARRLEPMEALRPYGVTPFRLDVTEETSLRQAVEFVMREEQRIDVLINNAGYGCYGAIEDVGIEDAKQQFEVNVFGLVMLTQQVLPIMRAQGTGRIVNVSSAAGRFVNYLGGWYHASKYAVEALSDALRMETKAFGIDVVLIEPGGIKTDWGALTAQRLKESAVGGAYEEAAAHTADRLQQHYAGHLLSEPAVIAKTIAKAVACRRPKPRYLVGFGARPILFLHAVLPTRAFDRLAKHLH